MTVRFVLFVLLGLAATALVASPAAAVDPRDLEGSYIVKGFNPDGSKYEGTAEIKFEGGKVISIKYKYFKRTDIGQGRVEGDTVTVTYTGAVSPRQGGAKYEVQGNGNLVGWWRDKGGKRCEERLIRK